jgi:hypothetical protein
MTLNEKLDRLIDQWCERRALKLLRTILKVYPGSLTLPDDFANLLAALKDIKKLYWHELTPEELTLVTSLLAEVEKTVTRK